MVKRIKTILALLVAIGVLGGGTIAYAQPSIPKENIPSYIAADVRKQIERLHSSDPKERAYAADELGKIGASAASAIPYLIVTLGDMTSLVWWLDVTGKGFPHREDTWYLPRTSPGEEAAKALTKIGEPAVEPLIVALNDKDGDVRCNAAWALGGLKNGRAVQPLIAALKDENSDVRGNSAEALGNIADPGAVEPLIAALKDQNSDVRGNSAEALGNIGDPFAVEPLIAALKDEHSKVRERSAEALGNIADRRAVEPLNAALKDEYEPVRQEATWALVKLKAPEALDPLLADLRDEDPDVRGTSAEALGNLGDPRAVEPLIAALDDEELHVQVMAVYALRMITRENFGSDPVKWLDWWEQNKEDVLKGR